MIRRIRKNPQGPAGGTKRDNLSVTPEKGAEVEAPVSVPEVHEDDPASASAAVLVVDDEPQGEAAMVKTSPDAVHTTAAEKKSAKKAANTSRKPFKPFKENPAAEKLQNAELEPEEPTKLIAENGFPPAIYGEDFEPSASQKKAEPPVTLLSGTFHLLTELPALRKVLPRAWHYHDDMKGRFTSEGDVDGFVQAIFREVCATVDSQLSVSSQHSIGGNYVPDVCLMASVARALAAIEVKLPGGHKYKTRSNAWCGKSAHLQMWNYLVELKYHGVSAPLGIITTYNQWQFCCLPSDAAVFEATTLADVRALSPSNRPNDDPAKSVKLLVVSELFECDHPDLLKLLVSFVLKVAAIPHSPPCFRYTSMSIKEISCYTSVISRRRRRLGKLCTMMCPSTRYHFLVDPIPRSCASGSDLLLLANDDGDRYCVAKFGETSALKKEREMWSRLGIKSARMGKLNNEDALLMPYYQVFTDDDWDDSENHKLVLRAINDLFAKGVFHPDLARRHVAWSGDNVVLIGWGSMASDTATPNEADYMANARRLLQICTEEQKGDEQEDDDGLE